ncbi:MAG: Gfo/Idh/MocA family oxidoreductase, partial [Gemmatimonadetes bacterium]|nr:Gfo/Idh/MocA family oxidoreductase [Gemmatimonadota bacterium]
MRDAATRGGARSRRPLRIAFLGCGSATAMHGRTLRRFRGEAECAYASRHAARAEEYARRFGGTSFASYDAALEDARTDAVLVATPPMLHLELTLRALEAGKHVIVEKPPFVRAADFDRVAASAARVGRQVLVAENYFYKPLTAELRAIVESGVLGRVLFVQLNAIKRQPADGWRADPALAGGGALFEGGIHWLNFAGSLGLTVRSAQALFPGHAAGPERSSLVALRYEEGAVGALLYSWETHSPLRGLRLSRIFGTRGNVTFESNGVFVAVSGPG